MDGDSIENLHCSFDFALNDGDLELFVTPFPQDQSIPMEVDGGDDEDVNDVKKDDSVKLEGVVMSLVTVNGVNIREKLRLKDGDIVCMGISTLFVVHVEFHGQNTTASATVYTSPPNFASITTQAHSRSDCLKVSGKMVNLVSSLL